MRPARQQGNELFFGQPGLTNEGTERALGQLGMVGHGQPPAG